MKSQYINTLLIAVMMICLVSLSATAATITVNTLTDENNTNAAACSLREAMNNANGDNTTNGLGCVAGSGTDAIVISVNGTITPTSNVPTISTSMSVTGNGAGNLTIDGNLTRRLFLITGGTVSINNLTMSNGTNSVQGGAIFINGTAVVTISGAVISNSRAQQGGGIENEATLTINSSTFTDNRSTTQTGGAVNNIGTLTVSNSKFINGQASSQGGAIANSGSLSVSDSTFTNNTAVNYGGALVNNGGSLFSVTRSTFTVNSASEGGALYITSPSPSTLTNVTFFNNSGNSGSAVTLASAVTMTNCTVTGNRSPNSNVQVTGGSAAAILINNIIAGNTDYSGLSPIDIDLRAGGIIVAGSSFNNIVGTGGSGGLTNGVQGNQIGVSPESVRMLSFGNYGGSVQTIPIRINSPARNAGTDTGAPATDARGFNRPQASTTDIGAFEIQTISIVTNVADSGTGSLRQTVAGVTAGDVIQFESPLFDTARTISLSGGQISPAKNMTIYGNGANLLDVSNTQGQSATSRVFNISGGTTVNLTGMTVSGGNATANGGGIFVAASGNLTIDRCHVRSNASTSFGGGAFSMGVLNVLNSTVSANTSFNLSPTGSGSGINNGIGGTLNLTNSTVSGNTAPLATDSAAVWTHATATTSITNSTITNNLSAGTNSAGGIYNQSGAVVTVRNSIVAGNQNNSSMPDVTGAFTSQGYNLVGNRGTATGFTATGDQTGSSSLFAIENGKSMAPAAVLDPGLLPLAMNGGTVPTHALSGSSAAIDKGNSFGSTADARGSMRPVDLDGFANAAGGDASDIGAYEAQLVPTAAGVSICGMVFTADGRGLNGAVITLTGNNGEYRMARTSSFGYYAFAEVAAGETYVIAISSKRYTFTPQVIFAADDIAGLNLYAMAPNR